MSFKAVEECNMKVFPKHSVMLVSIGTIGKISIAMNSGTSNQQINTIIFNEFKMSPFFGFYFLYANKEMIKHFSNISLIAILNQSQTEELILAVPPLSEQKAIADYLDKKTSEIDQIIEAKKKLIALYNEEKSALINKAVTKGIDDKAKLKPSGIEWLGDIPQHWEVKKFRYLYSLNNNKSDKDLKKIALENIESKTGKLIDTNTEFAGTGIEFNKDDILFGKLRPYLAKVYLSDFHGEAVGDFYVFTPNLSEVNPIFSKYRILDYSFIDLVSSSTYGAKMPRASWDFISNLMFAVPPLKEQEKIVDYIEKNVSVIDKKVANAKRLIELMTEYRTTLISEVVTGKVKVV
ncbi:MAG: restriction endonuclease subunit S [Candidatus Kapaibacterium sp.]